MKFYYFYSKFGYNDTVREGKIYKFTSNETLKYVLEINIDPEGNIHKTGPVELEYSSSMTMEETDE